MKQQLNMVDDLKSTRLVTTRLFPTHGQHRTPRGFAMAINALRRAAATGHLPKTLARTALRAAGVKP